LLVTSLVFFVWSSGWVMLLQIAYAVAVTYLGARLVAMGAEVSLRRKRIAYICSLALLLVNLIALKYVYNLGSLLMQIAHNPADLTFMQLVAPIGISYFTLSAIGYLTDVYWESYPPEKNVVKIALLISYFPCIVSGPVVRYYEMSGQFSGRRDFDRQNISNAMRRMAWGYLKKMVVADKLAVIVSAVFASYSDYPGAMVLLALLCYAFQLYADFSGCMDICLGASMLYGVKLPENFDAPFFSRSLPEFWRRWHITLGTWFKDYVMYPVQKSRPLQALGKKSKKAFGKKVGKKIPLYLSTLVLWFLIGLWHGGTAVYFLASGLIPCIFLLGSDLLSPVFAKIVAALHIKTECFSYRWFQRIRTFLLMCGAWLFICAGSVSGGIRIFKYMFTSFHLSALRLSMLTNMGVGLKYFAIAIGLAAMLVVDWSRNRKLPGTEVLDQQNLPVRWVALWLEILVIFVCANVGQSAFIYNQF
ncbi:MAG: hypothetical protein LUI02_05690, partial [Clostridiales bacterium]|nr:hypothetical protein [Clostridiales bacterium]